MEDLYASFLHCTRKNDAAALECIESFVARSIPLKDVRDKGNNTLLHQSASRGCPVTAKLLLEYGLDRLALNDQAKTPVSISDDFKGYGKGYKAVYNLLRASDDTLKMKVQQTPVNDGATEHTNDTPASAITLLGQRIVKEFPGWGFFEGFVATDEGEKGLRIIFEDGKVEFLTVEETVPLAAKFREWHGEKKEMVYHPGQPECPRLSKHNANVGEYPFGAGKRVQVLWDKDKMFYAGTVIKSTPLQLDGPLTVQYDNGDVESKLLASNVVMVEQKGVKWARQVSKHKGSQWWPSMVWEAVGSHNSAWSFVQFLGQVDTEGIGRNAGWLGETTTVSFEDGLETHLDGVLGGQGSLQKIADGEHAVELAFAELSREKSRGQTRKRKRKGQGASRERKKPKDTKTAAEKRKEMYEEEIFYTCTDDPIFPAPLLGSEECQIDFNAHAKRCEATTLLLRRLYGWISKRSYLDWGLTSSANQYNRLRTCRTIQADTKDAQYGRVTEGYWTTPIEHSNMVKDEIKRLETVDSTTQGSEGYGEVTQGSVTRLVHVLCNLRSFVLEKLPRKPDTVLDAEWDLAEESSFLDIGSGYGKVVFHVKMMCHIQRCVGIECVFSRDEIANTCLTALKKDPDVFKPKKGEKPEPVPEDTEMDMEDAQNGAAPVEGAADSSPEKERQLDLTGIEFNMSDAAGDKFQDGHNFSHIYIFDRVFSRATLRGLAKVLHASPFRVLISSKHWRVWWGHGLLKIQPVGKIRVYTTGKECITMFVYINTDFFPAIETEEEPEPEEAAPAEAATANGHAEPQVEMEVDK